MVERVFPGRLIAGIGHGSPEWMAQVGAVVPGKLALLEETITVVKALLRGEEVSFDGRVVKIDGVRLVHPPAKAPAVVAGVVRPRSLELSGRVADGTVIAEGQGPREIAAALGYIRKGQQAGQQAAGEQAGEPGPHEVVVFTHLCVGDDAGRVEELMAPVVEEYTGWLKVPAEDVFLAAGPVATAAGRIRSLWEAGAHTVVLRPVGEEPGEQVRQALEALGG
jgi:alkanesulfonate monooxygenase SsuD/methylene tetrahydromethanopterin reductase-like flavin-dependent oxidoreductase (luciferase family)